MQTYKSIQIDEEGFLHSNGLRLNDEALSRSMLSSLYTDEHSAYRLKSGAEDVFAEPFDYPLVAQQVTKHDTHWTVHFSYGLTENLNIKTLATDLKDRFIGTSMRNLPFVMSRKAQSEFFNLLDDFTDDTITTLGQTSSIPQLYGQESDGPCDASFWNNKYQENPAPPWDLSGPHPEIGEIVSRLKLNKARVLVLGAGNAHDADFLAKQGHKVTAVDISEDAIQLAREKYGQNQNLKFVQANFFDLPKDFSEAFDLVFEYTCYCAIHPERRRELIQIWKRCLVPGGNLLGIFWTFFKPHGPPFGSTEWEIRENLKKNFRFLLWERLKKSPSMRLGFELMVFAEKTDPF